MSSSYTHIIEACLQNGSVVIDTAKGKDGLWAISLVTGDKYFFVPKSDTWHTFVDELLTTGTLQIAVWDLRRIIDWPLRSSRIIYDVKSLYGGELNLPAAVAKTKQSSVSPVYQRFLDLDQKITAHARALKTVHIDVSVNQAIPIELLTDWIRARTVVISELFKRINAKSEIYQEYLQRWPFILALRQMELNGIHVDTGFIEQKLNGDPEPAAGKALRSMQSLQRNGYVTTLINPIGAKTGRCRLEGGFNSLGVPHGAARDAITSRFDGGLIYTLDFNAIDYRCIVKAIGGEVERLYEGADDFHARTASFIFKEVNENRRTAMKYLAYIYIYGGSEETLVQKTGWSLEQVRMVVEMLDKKILPIKEFRERLKMEGELHGFIKIPGGRNVEIGPDDSPGKIIGLFAQSYSAWVFEQAFCRVTEHMRSMKSKIIFAVHDELVIDAHPDEFERMAELIPLMQMDGNVVKMKKGTTYGSQH